MSYRFVNDWVQTLSTSMSNSTTDLTPSITTGLPWTLDPTAGDPDIAALIIDCDPTTGRSTASTEVVTVTDTRTVPWTVIRADEAVAGGVAQGAPIAHAAGVPIAFVASQKALEALVNPNVFDLTGMAGWGSAVDGDIATFASGLLTPAAGSTPAGVVDFQRNVSGVPDGWSTTGATAGTFGNTVPVTDGAGNPLMVTTAANPGRPQLLSLFMPGVRGTGTTTGLRVYVILEELTPAADLTAAGLTRTHFGNDGEITVPGEASARFSMNSLGRYLDASLATIPRMWGASYALFTATTGNSGSQVENLNTADVTYSVVTVRALTSNVATLTTGYPHGFIVGDSVTVSAVNATFNGTFTLTAVTARTFSYAKTAADVAAAPAGGTATTTPGRTLVRGGTRFIVTLG